MNSIYKTILRGSVLTGAMFLADGFVNTLCPNARGIGKLLACLASVTIFGAAADKGTVHAIEVLDNAQRKLKG